MRALLLVDTPKKLLLSKIQVPNPAPGEVLVKIKAASLNRRDQWMREGKYPGIKFNTILGSDAAGIVEKAADDPGKEWVGKDVIINPNIGWGPDPRVQSKTYRILGMPDHGTFTEYICVPVDRLAEKPAHLSYAQAASLPLGALTAYRALFTKGKLQANQNVLISGVGGGVAQFAYQFAQASGADVYVTTGSDQKLAKIPDLKPKHGFNYKKKDWMREAINNSGGFRLIIDSAGGEQLNEMLKILKPGGRIVFYGATNGVPKQLDLHRMFWNQLTINGSTMGNDQEFIEMVNFVDQKKIIPIIDSIRPFDDIISAFDDMANGSQTGKLVVEM